MYKNTIFLIILFWLSIINVFAFDHLGSVRVVLNQNMTVLEQNDYYPFGLRHPNSALKTTANRYRYNGKEEIATDATSDYGARQYSAEFCQWLQVDPLAENYYSTTPYGFCNNNAMRYVDLDGCEFTENAWIWVNRLIDNIDSRQASNNASIAQLQARIDAGGLSESKLNRLNNRIDRLNANSAELETVRNEIGVLAASDQVYDVKTSNQYNTNDTYVAGTTFNFTNGNVEIIIPSYTSLALFSHELKHAYQFETGAFSLGRRKNGEPFYDKTDELEAYARGSLFGGENIRALESRYNHIQNGPMDATKLAPIILTSPTALQKIANNNRTAFRINGATYKWNGGK